MNENEQGQGIPQVVVAARKIEGKWESVLLIKGEFERTFTGDDVSDLLKRALAPFTSIEYPDDTRVQVTLNMSIPADKKGD